MAFTCRALRAGAAAAGITLTMATTLTAPVAAATGGAGRVVRAERPAGVTVTTVVFKERADGTRIAVPIRSSRIFPTVHYTVSGPGCERPGP